MRLRLTKREDGYVISTVKSYDNWYGFYETAIMLEGLDYWKIAEGYKQKKKQLKDMKNMLQCQKKKSIE